jgi:flavin reductase (DIM6/NTAB) family NADH-FMN oxidoreductase RutF
MTRVIEPAILYVGTPVVLVSTLDEHGRANLAPFSSAWWLGYGFMLGITASAQTAHNLRTTGECVINLPSPALAAHVDRIALTTGAEPVPPDKAWLGFEHEAQKWSRSGLTAVPSETVRPARALECPLQLEATVESINPFGAANPMVPAPVLAVEVRIRRVHAHESILLGDSDRIDPDTWSPLIMSFRRFYGLTGQVHGSRLSGGDEERWRPVSPAAAGPPSGPGHRGRPSRAAATARSPRPAAR